MLYAKGGITESKASCYRMCFRMCFSAACTSHRDTHEASRPRPNLETYFHHYCRDFYIVFVNGGMKSKLILWLLRPCILNFDYHFLKESFHKKTIGLTVQSQAAFNQHAVQCVWVEMSLQEAPTPGPRPAGVRRLRRRCWASCKLISTHLTLWNCYLLVCIIIAAISI